MTQSRLFTKENGKSVLNESSFIYWGKRKGKPVIQLAKTDPEYLLILNERSKFFRVAESVLKVAKQNINWQTFLAK